MKTWKTREGKWVSEQPKEYLIGVDKHGEEVFINDILIWRWKYSNKSSELIKANKYTSQWTLDDSYLKKY